MNPVFTQCQLAHNMLQSQHRASNNLQTQELKLKLEMVPKGNKYIFDKQTIIIE